MLVLFYKVVPSPILLNIICKLLVTIHIHKRRLAGQCNGKLSGQNKNIKASRKKARYVEKGGEIRTLQVVRHDNVITRCQAETVHKVLGTNTAFSNSKSNKSDIPIWFELVRWSTYIMNFEFRYRTDLPPCTHDFSSGQNLGIITVRTGGYRTLPYLVTTLNIDNTVNISAPFLHKTIFSKNSLKGLSHEIDFKTFDKNLQNLA
jgi:hypothetical protein